MAWHRLWIIAYDIAEPRRLRAAAKLLESVGERQQYSVFEAALSADAVTRLSRQLHRITHPSDDRVLLHPCCANCRAGIRWQGKPPGPDHEPFWIV